MNIMIKNTKFTMKILMGEITMKGKKNRVTKRRKLRENIKKSALIPITSTMKTQKEIL